jgi:hypothetical protein
MQFEVLADPDATVGLLRQAAWMDRPITPGGSYRLVATLRSGGVNFNFFSTGVACSPRRTRTLCNRQRPKENRHARCRIGSSRDQHYPHAVD